MIPDLKKIKTQIFELQQFQDSVAEVLGPIRAAEVVDGVLISGVVIPTGTPKSVAHKLGRPPQGWIVVSKNAASDVWEDITYSFRSKFLRLSSSADVTINLWVF